MSYIDVEGRFDGNVAPLDDLDKQTAEAFPGTIEAHTIRFTGRCPGCSHIKQSNL
ncbi:MAG: hypothetical protein NC180_11580 [Muribaculaceae bacterium]|nr:hypothetical protein [Roseburia sp.]MCM1429881.1 hypothetical protein [Muribaculaceae bacterium]MCM1493851.1 hypothetical protein [Muribaculaceae bacterium]